MRCIRILPETWARTLWPLSISTRNIALGSGSTTLPSTSIASSLLMAFRPFIGVLDGRPMRMRAEMTTGAPNTMALATWTRRHGQEGADTREHIIYSAPALMEPLLARHRAVVSVAKPAPAKARDAKAGAAVRIRARNLRVSRHPVVRMRRALLGRDERQHREHRVERERRLAPGR